MNSMIILNVLLLLALIIVCVALAIRQHRDQQELEELTKKIVIDRDFFRQHFEDYKKRLDVVDMNIEALIDMNNSNFECYEKVWKGLRDEKRNQNKINRSFSDSLRAMRKEYRSLNKIDSNKVVKAMKKEMANNATKQR